MSLLYFYKPSACRITPKERGMILGGIRKSFSRSRWAWKVREAAMSDQKGPRGGKMYVCEECGETVSSNKINVDHIEPVVEIGKKYTDYTWDQLVTRLWCPIENLQVLCVDCHKRKSREEAKERRQARKNTS